MNLRYILLCLTRGVLGRSLLPSPASQCLRTGNAQLLADRIVQRIMRVHTVRLVIELAFAVMVCYAGRGRGCGHSLEASQ